MKTVNSLDCQYAIVVHDRDVKVKLTNAKELRTEEKPSSVSDSLYFGSFSGMFGFLKDNSDLVDAVICSSLPCTSLSKLEKILDVDGMRCVLFKLTKPDLSFFYPKYKGKLTESDFCAILNDQLDTNVHYTTNDGQVYILVERN